MVATAEQDKGQHSLPSHPFSQVKRVVGFISGKGGVGKSLTTALAASSLARLGLKVGILDADLTGPSIPQAFGLKGKIRSENNLFIPEISPGGVKIISMNLLLPEESDPVIWRGPVLAAVVKRFWQETHWDYLDYLLVDLPPGTGDVPLTVFQALPLDGVLLLSSPQALVQTIVKKAVKMCHSLNVPILGLLENYAYFRCPDTGKEYELFGQSKAAEFCASEGIELLCRLPIQPELARLVDEGRIEHADVSSLIPLSERLLRLPPKPGFNFPDGPRAWHDKVGES